MDTPELEAVLGVLGELSDEQLDWMIVCLTQIQATRRATADIEANPVQHEAGVAA
jgi:hypothetical protein